MTTKRRFTDQMLERLNPPKAGRLELADDVFPGLVLRVMPSGAKTFGAIYRVPGEGGLGRNGAPRKGRQHRVTLGRWPVLTVAEARMRARGVLARACAGVDPRDAQRRAAAEREAGLMSVVAERYVRQSREGTLALHSWHNIARVMRLHVLPRFGDRHIGDIRQAETHELLDDLIAIGRTGTAREVKKQLSRFFNWAVDRELVEANPVFAMKRPDLAPATEAGRALSDQELTAIWRAASEMRYPFGR